MMCVDSWVATQKACVCVCVCLSSGGSYMRNKIARGCRRHLACRRIHVCARLENYKTCLRSPGVKRQCM